MIGENEAEWPTKVEISMVEFQAAGEACKAINVLIYFRLNWHSCVLSRQGFKFCVRSTPLRAEWREDWEKNEAE